MRIGAYRPGADPELDRALHGRAEIRRFLEQDANEDASATPTFEALADLAARL